MTARSVRPASCARRSTTCARKPEPDHQRPARRCRSAPSTARRRSRLAYVIAIMNMILHGIEAPNIVHTNTLAENLADIQEKDRYDVVLANPPFGGKERKEVQQNFPIKTGETAFLFLQHFIKIAEGRAAGRASSSRTRSCRNTDNASVCLRKLLLEAATCTRCWICRAATFQGAGVKTVVLFFEKGAPTRKVWYYQLESGRNMGKTNPLNDDDLAEFVDLQGPRAELPNSWNDAPASIDPVTLDLTASNPHGGGEADHRNPREIADEIEALEGELGAALARIRALL